MFFAYSLLYTVALLVLLPYEYFRRPKGFRRRWLKERFGLTTPPSVMGDAPVVWIHAVSVGEVLSAIPLIRELKGRYPSLCIVISTVTDTGQKLASDKISDIAYPVYLPFDLVSVLKGLMKRVRPRIFITMETELWPNIFRVLRKEGIPILVLNGRISDRSFNGYRKVRFFIKEVIRWVDMFCMQEEVYKKRIQELGADEHRIRVIGNFKFDTPPDTIPGWVKFLRGPVIVAGSTHEGEEELLVSVYMKLRNAHPELNLIIAPRHPERFQKVEEMLGAQNLPYTKRSDMSPQSAWQEGKNNQMLSGIIIILDTIGELAPAYGMADVAVIGGSFANHGGHNPLEPVFWARPVVCGPHMENFPFIQDFYREGAALETSAEGLYGVLDELLSSPKKRSAMGKGARLLYDKKAGAVQRAMAILERYLNANLPVAKEKSLP
ncbi:MAG TPA: 3-deoxy-D-manno-octulosonic acid transferase [Thermodesulfovibrionales bacterium]|nr:3-deoxy-D-manno-octulosonic acid transferase [Thermodesulfovibrionales bacterium]